MTEIVTKFLDLIPQLVPWIVPLIAVYLGWRLSYRSEAKKRALDILDKQLYALRELKSVAQNIPRGIVAEELTDRMESEPEFLSSLKHRLVRLLGLRIELIPHLDASTIQLLDEQFAPLFDTHTGQYILRSEATQEFAIVCVDILRHVDQLESHLVESYRRLTKK
jgi:hypothetical protein